VPSAPYLVELLDTDGDTSPHVVIAHNIPDALAAFGEDFFYGWAGVTVRELDDAAFRAFVASTKPVGARLARFRRRKKAAG
jgi:hypothetical protein